MDYIFKWSSQNSNFFNNVLSNGKFVFFPATFVINFSKTCYNLLLKKNFRYFIDPESFKFQTGGDKKFFSKYLEYFDDIEELFDDNNLIKMDLLENENYFNDFYHKILQFQERTLARTTIPLEYYMSLVSDGSENRCFNPNANILFRIAPYFEFSQITENSYIFTQKFAETDRSNYVILRFPKILLLNVQFREKIYQDFHDNSGIIFNVLELDQYNELDLNTYFPILIELINKFSKPNCETILMNNAEFSKYFKLFGLKYVCSNVMIGQKTRSEVLENNSTGGSTNLVYIPQIERCISFEQGEVLRARNNPIRGFFPRNVSELDFDERILIYYRHLTARIQIINQASFQEIMDILLQFYNQITEQIHRDLYKHILKWIDLITSQFRDLNR